MANYRQKKASIRQLMAQSRAKLGITQIALSGKLGTSTRTGQRWASGVSEPSGDVLMVLAKLVQPVDGELAGKIAVAAGSSRGDLDLYVTNATRASGDAIVCAASEAADVSPRAMRRGLAAAIARSRELGVRIDELANVIKPPA